MADARREAVAVLAVGPNPAVQRVLSFPAALTVGGVNRAASVEQYVGGKGQGVALALERWAPGSSRLAQFLGGEAIILHFGCRESTFLQLLGHEATCLHLSCRKAGGSQVLSLVTTQAEFGSSEAGIGKLRSFETSQSETFCSISSHSKLRKNEA